MKKSRYNFFFEKDEKNFVFNALTCALAEISDDFIVNLDRAVKGEAIEKKLLDSMKESGVLIEDCFDELDFLKLKSYDNKFGSKGVGITIAPTLLCNFACPYCYENPEPTIMDSNVMDAICSRVEATAAKKEPVKIVWFGGEPLLAKNVIWELSHKMINICKKYNADYSALMISNGYLIDDDTILKLIQHKISKVQITVDGPPDIHNARRKLKNSTEPTFDKILSNIKKMTTAGIRVTIRANIDKTNTGRLPELVNELKKYELEDCFVYLGRVRDSTDFNASISDTCLELPEYSTENVECQRIFMKNGFKSKNYPMYPPLKGNFCLADCASMFAVDAQGYMYKCWHDLGNKSKTIGNILKTSEPSIETQQQCAATKSQYMLWSPFNFKKCIECEVLPMCMGGCPSAGIKASEPDCLFWKHNLIDLLKLKVEAKTHH